jgi:hypothetical protein
MSALFMLSAMGASAQVTVGSLDDPQDFSILELISNSGGLRLPQMTTAQRETMQETSEFKSKATADAMGLQIFNLDTKCVETWNGVEWISKCAMCGDQPCVYYPPSEDITPNSGGITTFTNVMYDFQHQTIEAYNFSGTPESYQWYAKRKGAADTEYKGISGATAINYTAPADFVKNIYQPLVSDNDADYNDNIIFVCLAKYNDGTYEKTPEMDILFIGTNTEGYGTDENGVKYAVLQSGTSNSSASYSLYFFENNVYAGINNYGKAHGFSVRCVED